MAQLPRAGPTAVATQPPAATVPPTAARVPYDGAFRMGA
jgi:hypothetical protein